MRENPEEETDRMPTAGKEQNTNIFAFDVSKWDTDKIPATQPFSYRYSISTLARLNALIQHSRAVIVTTISTGQYQVLKFVPSDEQFIRVTLLDAKLGEIDVELHWYHKFDIFLDRRAVGYPD